MSEYQRIVSYLYEYKNGIRGNNVGFARVETRDQQLKISFTLNTAQSLPLLTLYFYYYDHGKMLGIPWDEIKEVPRHCEYKETFRTDEVFQNCPPLIDMDGILFYYDDHHFYGSQWKENSINLRLFEKPHTRPPQLEEYIEALSLHEQTPFPEEADISSEAATSKETLPSTSSSTKEEVLPSPDEVWEHFPKLEPVLTPDYSDCIKIHFDDIPSLPFLPKDLSGNGFLKMQVQSYGHLVLGRKKLTDSYYVGIPGVFSNQRNFVAHLFGFPEFITIPKKNLKTGNFGYWIMTISH